jgi:hypothetical protein
MAAVAAIAVLPALAQAQTHYWSLDNTYADFYGGPSMTPDGGTLGPNGYTFGVNSGLSVTGVFTGGVYSIAFRASLDETGGYRKLLDFSGLVSDAGYYDYFTDANLYPTAYSAAGVYNAGQLSTTVLTRDANKNMQVFIDGTLVFNFVDTNDYYAFTSGTAWFFEDDFATSRREASSGYVDWIATYDVALGQGDIPVDNVSPTPEPASLALFATGLVAVAGFARRRRK